MLNHFHLPFFEHYPCLIDSPFYLMPFSLTGLDHKHNPQHKCQYANSYSDHLCFVTTRLSFNLVSNAWVYHACNKQYRAASNVSNQEDERPINRNLDWYIGHPCQFHYHRRGRCHLGAGFISENKGLIRRAEVLKLDLRHLYRRMVNCIHSIKPVRTV